MDTNTRTVRFINGRVGVHDNVPPVNVEPISFRNRIASYVSRYLATQPSDIVVDGAPDHPTGSVSVRSAGRVADFEVEVGKDAS